MGEGGMAFGLESVLRSSGGAKKISRGSQIIL